MKTIKKVTLFLILGLIVIGTQTGCKKDKDESPALPPENSMIMDLGFNTMEKSGQAIISFHGTAALAVIYWSAVATVHTAIPTAAFKKAIENKPTWDSQNKVWVWSYNVPIVAETYEAKLTGKIENDSVKWEMYLSKSGINNLKNILWFEGKSHYGRTGGWWVLNYPRLDGTTLEVAPAIRVDWKHIDNKDFSLKYTYVADKEKVGASWVNNENKGGYIEHGRENKSKYDAYYYIYSKKENKKYNIFWNIENREGKIELEGDWSGCWDTNLQNKPSCE
jgi:hypothetical protein